MKVLKMNLMALFKPHQSIDVSVLAVPLLNFFTIIKVRNHVIPFAQLAKLINRHIVLIRVMHTHKMILLKCNTIRAKGKYQYCTLFLFSMPSSN